FFYVPFFFFPSVPPPHLHSFPTRRSSDLCARSVADRHPVVTAPRSQCRDSVEQSSAAGRRRSRASRRSNSPHDRSHPGPEHSARSEEHTSELQSQSNLVCRLLLEKKKKKK